MCLIKTVMQTL